MKRSPQNEQSASPTDGRAAGNRSVDRACAVMSAFSIDEPALALAELARRVELPKPTVYRLVSSLVARGFMVQGSDSRYGLGVKLMECGAVVRENLDVVVHCADVIDQMAAATAETVLVTVADWATHEVVLVARRDSPHMLSVVSPVGRRMKLPPGGALARALLSGLTPQEAASIIGRLPLTASTPKTHVSKRVLLRDLEQARALGYAAEQDEYIDGVSGVAVPVIFEGARPQAALGVVGPTSRVAGELGRIGELLRDATAHLRPPDGPAAASNGGRRSAP
jgi:DNA-binding IclR family transcriptional regulator